jgi:hypothetical protein
VDIEQLKLILAALEKAGDGAFFIALLHFGHPYLVTLGLTVFAVVGAFCVRSVLLRLVATQTAESDVRALGRLMGVNSGYEHLAGRDYAETISKLRLMVERGADR